MTFAFLLLPFELSLMSALAFPQDFAVKLMVYFDALNDISRNRICFATFFINKLQMSFDIMN